MSHVLYAYNVTSPSIKCIHNTSNEKDSTTTTTVQFTVRVLTFICLLLRLKHNLNMAQQVVFTSSCSPCSTALIL